VLAPSLIELLEVNGGLTSVDGHFGREVPVEPFTEVGRSPGNTTRLYVRCRQQ